MSEPKALRDYIFFGDRIGDFRGFGIGDHCPKSNSKPHSKIDPPDLIAKIGKGLSKTYPNMLIGSVSWISKR